jgi:ATP-dependent helicase YprA (DUF1998 family)/predicted RNA-binding protein YlxR (DUF448 family)
MAMNPISTKTTIEKDYLSYLEEILVVRDKEINRKSKRALLETKFVKGPYLEATLPFVSGKTLHQLVDEGVISKEFSTINNEIHYDRPLRMHQEIALRKIVEHKKNVIVATGTGSGKTECYLYPIFDELMKEKEKGELDSGVRALLLFPMNALANDQLKKLRMMLKNYPEITFGRYTGETKHGKEEVARKEYEKEHGELPLNNEMLTRGRMQETPPHILLTNYAMLEYLLLRPEDSQLFDGENAQNWKFIVIDEAHTYRGTNGSEIAFLLRRVKERIRKYAKTNLQCIATSATLGDESAKGALAMFANNIFGEPFSVEDIVTSSRIELYTDNKMHDFSYEEYRQLKERSSLMTELEADKFLYEALKLDSRLIKLQKCIVSKPENVGEIANKIFPEYDNKQERLDAIILLIELSARAKPDSDSAALLPARYHLFIKALEGMYISLYPSKEVYLDQKASVITPSGKVSVFELANCQHCNHEFLMGRISNGKLELPLDHEPKDFFLIEKIQEELKADYDEDDDNDGNTADVSSLQRYKLCTVCGKIHPADEKHENCCQNIDKNKIITVLKLAHRGNGNELNSCPVCGKVKKSIMKGFYTSNHAATFTIANSLYNVIPSNNDIQSDSVNTQNIDDSPFEFIEHDEEIDEKVKDESGKKLLIFSDNRQEAAFFAGYLSGKHDQIMWRRLILGELENNTTGIKVGDLIDQLKVSAEKKGLYGSYSNFSDVEKTNIAARYVLKEFMEMENRTGLSGRGLVDIFPIKVPMRADLWGLSQEDTWNIMRFLMDTLRTAGAVQYPDKLPYNHEFFEPRNIEIAFRYEGSTSAIKSFLPAMNRNNRRSNFLNKLISSNILTCDSKAVLETTYNWFTQQFKNAGYFVAKTRSGHQNEGVVYAIDYKKWMIRKISPDEKIYRCSKCGSISTYNIGNICTAFKCDGKLEEVEARECQDVPYYGELYDETKIIPMVAKEHTAQLSKDTAGKYQEAFEKGKINVLSCSTTFEMGVDVGELEATFLRNVPPETANYIQRAGRAGRRTSSAAFAVTFARRNSHDLNFFNKPEDIISGKIRAPYIELQNEKIAIRHVNSIVMAWFFNKKPEFFSDVKTLLGDGDHSVLQELNEMLNQHPQELIESIRFVLDDVLYNRLNIESWEFANRLAGTDGILEKSINKRKSEVDQLEEIRDMYYEQNKYKAVNNIGNLLNTYNKEKCINFLSSSGVLPKYGFPIDVVDMTITDNSRDAQSIELTRDLKVAISEFAPPTRIVANGRVWKSYAINIVPKKGWPEDYFYECPKCKRIAPTEKNFVGYEMEDVKDEVKECMCGNEMRIKKFIEPIFGFSTSWDETPKAVGDEKPQRYYSTRTQFWGVDSLDPYQQEQRVEKDIRIGDSLVPIVYSPNGKLTVINRGKTGRGLFVCKVCGYVDENSPKKKHKNKFGRLCQADRLTNLSLGHSFNSDILRIELPHYNNKEYSFEQQWTSVLYAILEGASIYLDIDRNDINGCIDYEHGNKALILYDESAGGAGNVKRIAENLREVLIEAMNHVNGQCGCSDDTSCYGCLRNYNNQFAHEILIRGAARDYIEWLLKIK